MNLEVSSMNFKTLEFIMAPTTISGGHFILNKVH